MHLRCSAIECHTALGLHDRVFACPKCGELLEIVFDGKLPDPPKLKKTWLERRASSDPRDSSGVWRFREFLPDGYGDSEIVTMSEGNTPVLRGQRTAGWAGVRRLWFKHLGWNPTGSFKDLGMTVGITEAKFVGAKAVGCASTGNTAASLAAYAARAGLRAQIYLPAGQVSPNKLAQALDFGAEIIEVPGSFDDAIETLLHDSGADVYFLNSINPFRIEGQKTAMFELLEQFGWQAPDYLVVPGGNLGNSSAFGKAFIELKSYELIDKIPRMIVVQAKGANPFARLWTSGSRELQATAHPETVATAIRIGNPRSWKKALRAIEFTNGLVIDVTDEEIGEAKAMIGRDGIGCEPASATTLAGIRKLREMGTIDPDATIAAVLTGHALKDTDYIIKASQSLRDEAGAVLGI
ncbi:MAG: threonine synthase [Acidobacteriaceae bacterium]|nr:threonine synthase [Acidobacteriaceae bacterium]MBV9779958.1 threonine synthase [Acidobacteriaceae bacterium]